MLECLILRKDVLIDRTDLTERVYEGDVGNQIHLLDKVLRRDIGRRDRRSSAAEVAGQPGAA